MTCEHRESYKVQVDVDGDTIRLGTDLLKADPCLHEPILRSLAAHLGFVPEAMYKASRQKDLDPRYPELTLLVERAKADWATWGQQLIEAIRKLLKDGALLPMTDANRHALEELFGDHTVRLQLQVAGISPDRVRTERLVRAGLVDPSASRVEVAYRLGRGLEGLAIHRAQPESPDLDKMIHEALKRKLAKQDVHAIDYAKRKAAVYVRKPAERVRSEVERVLVERDLGAMRTTVLGVVERGDQARTLASDLRGAVRGPMASNDMDRIARTELAWAHSFGAYGALKADAAAAGIKDPMVFKFVSPFACDDCRRIWGPPGNPHHYPLSAVEAREAAGGNYGLPRSQWGPVLGPVHPNCFPAGTLIATHRGQIPIEEVEVGDQVWTHRGRWRSVYKTMSSGESLVMVVNGLPVTPGHPFLTTQGWVEASALERGMLVVRALQCSPRSVPPLDADYSGPENRIRFQRPEPVWRVDRTVRVATEVYNFSVEEDESYVAEGLFVHNCTEGPIQFYDPGLVSAINEAADELDAIFGGSR